MKSDVFSRNYKEKKKSKNKTAHDQYYSFILLLSQECLEADKCKGIIMVSLCLQTSLQYYGLENLHGSCATQLFIHLPTSLSFWMDASNTVKLPGSPPHQSLCRIHTFCFCHPSKSCEIWSCKWRSFASWHLLPAHCTVKLLTVR